MGLWIYGHVFNWLSFLPPHHPLLFPLYSLAAWPTHAHSAGRTHKHHFVHRFPALTLAGLTSAVMWQTERQVGDVTRGLGHWVLPRGGKTRRRIDGGISLLSSSTTSTDGSVYHFRIKKNIFKKRKYFKDIPDTRQEQFHPIISDFGRKISLAEAKTKKVPLII